MALTQVTAGNRIVTTDVNQFYNILKGVSGSGETITLIHASAASLIFQPSSDPAAGTEVVQVKNNAGTVQGSLTFDGKVKAADGSVTSPGFTNQGDENTGVFFSAADTLDVAAGGVRAAQFNTAGSAVNYVAVTPAATGSNAILAAAGSDTNVGLSIKAQGTSGIRILENVAAANLQFTAISGLMALIAAGTDTNIDIRVEPKGSGVFDLNYSTVALGGGSTPTLGTIGGSGPATAGQNSWVKVKVAGVATYLPAWR